MIVSFMFMFSCLTLAIFHTPAMVSVFYPLGNALVSTQTFSQMQMVVF